eukprot:4805859-Lingulodinium_polyedra.AAC.1
MQPLCSHQPATVQPPFSLHAAQWHCSPNPANSIRTICKQHVAATQQRPSSIDTQFRYQPACNHVSHSMCTATKPHSNSNRK